MENNDQQLRAKQRDLARKYGHKSGEAMAANRVIVRSDSLHGAVLDSLVQQSGWPRQYTVGKGPMNAVVTVLLHAPLAIQEKYLHAVKKSVENGELIDEALIYLQNEIEGAESGEKPK